MNIPELYKLFLEHPHVTTDTRDCPEGSFFFALRGANFDGNLFAAKALAQGAALAVVDNADVAAEDERMILVDDVLRTLQDLAAYHRKTLGLRVLQITGTNGKTTTKELCAAVLSEKYRVHYTQGNLNNHIGVPRTLLQLRPDHEMAVIESGANHPGEIRDLCRIIQADCGLITNVGKAHLEGFGSFEGVVRTKGELYDDLRTRPASFIFLHADDEVLRGIATSLPAYTYGAPSVYSPDVEGELCEASSFLHFRWRHREGEWHEVKTQLVGSYNLPNALAACAVGVRFGVDEAAICRALERYKPTNSRSELKETASNRLIVDAYNANPTSMAAALENFSHLASDRPKMVILGSMKELGAASEEEHKRLIAQLDGMKLEAVWLVGEEFKAFVHEPYRYFSSADAVSAEINRAQPRGYTILLKGSNSTRLHQLPALL